MDFNEGLAEGLRDIFQKRSGQSCHAEKEIAIQPKKPYSQTCKFFLAGAGQKQ
jgi:hypothetical protein